METTKKLKDKLHEIETPFSEDASQFSTDPTDSSSKKKKKKKIMQMESKKKGVSKTKSKDKQVCSDNSKNPKSIARKRTRYTDLYGDVEAQFTVMERAGRVLACLENGPPHFLKCMLPSNVAHGFWLHLPKKFCSLHLPHHDTSIVLVDEWGNEYKTSYLLGRHGLSAGWRGFSISHRLLKGDILIFHLTEPCKFKVHIVRVNGSDVVGAALCLMNLDACRQRKGSDESVKKDNRKRKKTKYVEPFQLDISPSLGNVKGETELDLNLEPIAYQSAPSNDGFSPEDLEGSEIASQAQADDSYYLETSFLRDRPREGVFCM